MAKTSLGPWKFVLDMGISKCSGFIIETGLEANEDNLGEMFFRSSLK